MKPIILTVHGFNSAGWYMKHFDPFAEERGLCKTHYGYGWLIFKSARMANIQQRVVDYVNDLQALAAQLGADELPVIGIGHSNGCEVLWRASQRCAHIRGLVFINAALDYDVAFPERLQFVHNWYSPSDLWPRLASWLPFNAWGDLGSRQYAGTSWSRVRNFNKERDFELSSKSHSDVFTDASKRNYFLPLMLDRALEAMPDAR